MSAELDRPPEEVQDMLNAYDMRILGQTQRPAQHTPWQKGPAKKRRRHDEEGTWTETHYTIRRNVVCEACGQPFGYVFEVEQLSRMQSFGRITDGNLRHELDRQLRQRLSCSHCHTVQKEPRRTLLRRDRRQLAQGCGLTAVGLLLASGLALLGGWQAGLLGFLAGLAAGLILLLVLWRSFLPRILAGGTRV
jgi:hypothetical protein